MEVRLAIPKNTPELVIFGEVGVVSITLSSIASTRGGHAIEAKDAGAVPAGYANQRRD